MIMSCKQVALLTRNDCSEASESSAPIVKAEVSCETQPEVNQVQLSLRRNPYEPGTNCKEEALARPESMVVSVNVYSVTAMRYWRLLLHLEHSRSCALIESRNDLVVTFHGT